MAIERGFEMSEYTEWITNQVLQEERVRLLKEIEYLRSENERLRNTIYKANQDYKELRREREQLKMYILELEATID